MESRKEYYRLDRARGELIPRREWVKLVWPIHNHVSVVSHSLLLWPGFDQGEMGGLIAQSLLPERLNQKYCQQSSKKKITKGREIVRSCDGCEARTTWHGSRTSQEINTFITGNAYMTWDLAETKRLLKTEKQNSQSWSSQTNEWTGEKDCM